MCQVDAVLPALVKFGIGVNVKGALVTKVSTTLSAVKLTQPRQILIIFKLHFLAQFNFFGDIVLNLVHISRSALCVNTLLILLVLPRSSSTVSYSSHNINELSK